MNRQHTPTDPDSYFNPRARRYDVTAYMRDTHIEVGDLYGPFDDAPGHNAAVMLLRNEDVAGGNVNPSTRRGMWWVNALCLMAGIVITFMPLLAL